MAAAIVLQAATWFPCWGLGLVVGAIVAATDPVAVISTFRQLGSPRRLATVVEAESLLNHGTALVVFAIAVRAVTVDVGLGEAVLSFVSTILISAIIGGVAGWVGSRVIALVDDHPIELSISLAAAYGTYLVADFIHQSGIIAYGSSPAWSSAATVGGSG